MPRIIGAVGWNVANTNFVGTVKLRQENGLKCVWRRKTMADFYVYDPAANEYVGPIKGVDLSTIDILSCEEYRTYQKPDGLWTVEFCGEIKLTNPTAEWSLYHLLEKWDQDISEHGGIL